MKELEIEEKNASGIFKDIIAGNTSILIDKFLRANVVDRFAIINEFKETAKPNDKVIPGVMFNRDKLVEKMVDAFEEASGMRESITRLEALLDTKPNLVKMVANQVRIGRLFDDLYRIPYILKLDYSPTFGSLPMLINTMLVTYGYKEEANNKYSGLLLSALLATYNKKISIIDYPSMWFVICFAKTISCNSILPPDTLKEHPELEEYMKPIGSLVSRINSTYEEDLKNATHDDINRVDDIEEIDDNDNLKLEEEIHSDNTDNEVKE